MIAAIGVTAVGIFATGAPRDPAPDASPTATTSSAATGTETPPPSASEPAEPLSPIPETTLEPVPTVAPAPDDFLALAGYDGVPGLLTCGSGFYFRFDALDNPTGAEDLVGPEYDALREFLRGNVSNGDPQLGPDPTAREVARYESRVAFLLDRADPGPWGENGGPYLHVHFNRVADGWEWGGSGDCQPHAVYPPGYKVATWRLDPTDAGPTARTRALHILVNEQSCTGGRSATGRIGPAYVTIDPFEVNIQVFVEDLPGGHDCQGNPETPARMRLPVPLGDRSLRDLNAWFGEGIGG